MKAKLTITVDEELIPEAKRYARSRGQSLSQLVEDGLRQTIAEDTDVLLDVALDRAPHVEAAAATRRGIFFSISPAS